MEVTDISQLTREPSHGRGRILFIDMLAGLTFPPPAPLYPAHPVVHPNTHCLMSGMTSFALLFILDGTLAGPCVLFPRQGLMFGLWGQLWVVLSHRTGGPLPSSRDACGD